MALTVEPMAPFIIAGRLFQSLRFENSILLHPALYMNEWVLVRQGDFGSEREDQFVSKRMID